MKVDRTRTLVVILERALAQQVCNSLESQGASVAACTTLDDARDEVAENSYGLVIVSTQLGSSDGFEATVVLKSIDPGIHVLLVGQDPDGRAAHRAQASGGSGFILQPLAPGNLLERASVVMGRDWFAHRPMNATGSSGSTPAFEESPAGGEPTNETGYDVSVLDSVEMSVVTEPVAPGAPVQGPPSTRHPADQEIAPAMDERKASSTMELPALAVEPFDENHPVSIAVGADVTAHAITPVRAAPFDLITGEQPPVSVSDPIGARIDDMLKPEGKLSKAIEGAVQQAIADALADQLPALLARFGGSDK